MRTALTGASWSITSKDLHGGGDWPLPRLVTQKKEFITVQTLTEIAIAMGCEVEGEYKEYMEAQQNNESYQIVDANGVCVFCKIRHEDPCTMQKALASALHVEAVYMIDYNNPRSKMLPLTQIAFDMGLYLSYDIVAAMNDLATDPDNRLFDQFDRCTGCGYYHDDVCEWQQNLAREVFQTAHDAVALAIERARC